MTDVIILGGGPAGLTAALYAARAGRSVLVLEGTGFGGQIVYSPQVDNYPGLPAVSGAEYADRLVEQVLALGAEVEVETAAAIAREGDVFRVETSGGPRLGRAVIVATGAAHRHLGLPGEDALVGRGVSYCAVCDGAFFKGKEVAVVGGGDTALQDARFLSALCRHVTLIHRRDQFRGEQLQVDRLRRCENVTFLLSHTVQALETEDGHLHQIQLRDEKTGQTRPLPLDGLFLAVGQQPQLAPFRSLLPLDEEGYAALGEDCTAPVPGLFVAGDCRSKGVRQLTTAAGDGSVAALAACRYLASLD